MFPREAYRRTWERLDQALSPRSACKVIVGLLELAGNYGVEVELAQQLEVLLELGELPDLEALFAQFAPRQAECPIVLVEMPDAPGVDLLSIIHKYDLPTSFPEAVEQQAADSPARIAPEEILAPRDFLRR